MSSPSVAIFCLFWCNPCTSAVNNEKWNDSTRSTTAGVLVALFSYHQIPYITEISFSDSQSQSLFYNDDSNEPELKYSKNQSCTDRVLTHAVSNTHAVGTDYSRTIRSSFKYSNIHRHKYFLDFRHLLKLPMHCVIYVLVYEVTTVLRL